MQELRKVGERASRLVHIDALRGLAIVTMVAANMAPKFLVSPHPPWLRWYGSYAAPLFVGIVGYVAAWQAERGKSITAQLWRAGVILLVAAAIDMGLYNIWPFIVFDVLYVISAACVAVPLLCRASTMATAVAAVGLIVGGPLLQWTAGYDPVLHVVTVDRPWRDIRPFYVFEQAIWTGYFPLCPWLGIALVGTLVYLFREPISRLHSRRVAVAVLLGLVSIGIGYYLAYVCERATRAGYSELFYPPDFAYLGMAASGCLALALIFRATSGQVWQQPLAWLGQSSMFFYGLHLTMIAFLHPAEPYSISGYLGWYILFLAVMFGLTRPLAVLRRSWPNRPALVKLLIT